MIPPGPGRNFLLKGKPFLTDMRSNLLGVAVCRYTVPDIRAALHMVIAFEDKKGGAESN